MEGTSSIQTRGHGHAGYVLIDSVIELGSAAFQAISSAVQAFIAAQAMAKARRELHGLSDRSLRDIGIERCDIDGIFR
jgi:uncharacterized protein YjiS (DUF1127 family)